MRNFTIATLAAILGGSQAIQLRQPETVTDAHNQWIGKYNLQNATETFLKLMHKLDLDQNGTVTLEEAISSVPDFFERVPDWVREEIANYDLETKLVDDLRLQTLVGPMFFDRDQDRALNKDELMEWLTSIGQENMFDEFVRADFEALRNYVGGLNYNGERRPGQFERGSEFLQGIMDANTNGDNAVSLKELLEAINDEEWGVVLDVEAYIQQYGRGYDWVNDDELFARILSEGVEFEDYESVYRRFDQLGHPWVLDVFLNGREEVFTMDHMIRYVRHIKDGTEDEWLYRPDDWIPLSERPSDRPISERFQEWAGHVDANSDDQISLEELITAGQEHGYYFDKEAILEKYGADYTFNFVDDINLFASMAQSKFTHHYEEIGETQHMGYHDAYHMMEMFGGPWIVDTLFDEYEDRDFYMHGFDRDHVIRLVKNWMYDSDDWEMPEGWLSLDERFVWNEPFLSDPEEIKEMVEDRIDDALTFIQELKDDMLANNELPLRGYEELMDIHRLTEILYMIAEKHYYEEHPDEKPMDH